MTKKGVMKYQRLQKKTNHGILVQLNKIVKILETVQVLIESK